MNVSCGSSFLPRHNQTRPRGGSSAALSELPTLRPVWDHWPATGPEGYISNEDWVITEDRRLGLQ